MGGIQKIYRFKNGYGASVIQTSFSYTDNSHEYEMAVIIFGDTDSDYSLCYDTAITDDVIGHLTKDEIEKVLKKIRLLK